MASDPRAASTPQKHGIIDPAMWRRGFALIDRRELRNGGVMILVVIMAAVAAAAMVGAIFPFLSVLSDPSKIETVAALAWAYAYFGFTSQLDFAVALGVASIAIILLSNLMLVLRLYVVEHFCAQQVRSISSRLLERYLHKPYEFFLVGHSGDMSGKILNESNQVVQNFLRPAVEMLASAISISMVVVVIFWIDPMISMLAFLVVGGIYTLISVTVKSALVDLGQRRYQANKARYRISNEALSGIKDIKLLNCEDAFVDDFDRQSAIFARSMVNRSLLTGIPPYLIQAVAFVGVILFALLSVDAANLSAGDALGGIVPLLGAFALAGQRLMPEFSKVYQSVGLLQYGRASVDAVSEDIHTDTPPQSTLSAEYRLQNSLELINISHRYATGERPSLHEISINVRAGEKIGIVGGSGAGKTTLADILLGLLEPNAGELKVDGTPISGSALQAWRRHVGYVPQEISLVDASIAENIALGTPQAQIDHAKIESAGRLAQLESFVTTELAEGYATSIGERGVRLSGGQRQRIGIARALYRDADLIVFDEATSALDTVTENELMAAIDALPGDKTLVMIAHRLTTVRRCDRILVLEAGRIAGFDSWDALMAKNSVFQALAKLHGE